MDRFSLLLYRSRWPWSAGSWLAWLALLAGVLVTLAMALATAVDVAALGDPDALLGPIRWAPLPDSLA